MLLDNIKLHIKTFLKWIIIATAVGVAGGLIGSAFHLSVDFVTHLRTQNTWIIFLLPIGALAIIGMYSIFKSKGKIDTNRVIDAVKGNERVPLTMTVLIFISTLISHLLGASVGREGAALQIGGSVGYNIGKVFKLKKGDIHIIVMAGMSGVFSALFGTPIAAAVFALEVASVGVMHYAAIVPSIVSAVAAYMIALAFGILPVRFAVVLPQTLSIGLVAKIIMLALLCAVVAIAFCTAIQKCEHYSNKLIKNPYLRALAGSTIIIGATLLIGTYEYNGAGMDVITRAMSGQARPEAFAIKIAFTAISIAAGFKGGEIVPTFFVGSTFGCVVAQFLGIDPVLGASVGFIALFCGVVNCPIASIFLSIEVFGGQGIPLFAIACAVSYMMSGRFGLYKSQTIVHSKLDTDYIDII